MAGRRIRARGARAVAIGLVVLGVMTPAWAESAEGWKAAYVDAQKVLDQSKAGKKAKDLMDEFVKSRQKIIDLEEAELKELEDSLGKQESVLSPEAKKTKQEELQRKVVAYQRKATELTREIQDKRAEVLNNLATQLQAVVKRVAEREGYTMVFDKGPGGPADLAAVLYAKESLSITDKVLAELDKEKEAQ